ncbi:hypothetical protein [Vibrio sp. SCSIO 43136]|uniref:hypothetical protein n=1 Tax=Vibrio sp. SCSIO 43136 TaxID=2819101 RepID=UPI0020753635|nr:hypothetical protein [Vibrio sp. SCSIO 43136]USD67378.1 hypothetical protein J4N39_22375 [Vibrio sp. SCSIO 43136]
MRHQDNPDLQLWLREAKVLHKAALSPSLANSLPVLRRLLSAKVLEGISLPELKSQSEIIQRKHLLHMLAAENGKRCWAEFKQQIESAPQGSILPNSLELKEAGYPVLWFSSLSEANRYSEEHGGKVIKVGEQAAVTPKME